jgi:hypothetical protein
MLVNYFQLVALLALISRQGTQEFFLCSSLDLLVLCSGSNWLPKNSILLHVVKLKKCNGWVHSSCC